MKVLVEKDGPVTIVTVNRPKSRNAIDGETAQLLADAFEAFEADEDAKVAILTGAGGHFGAGADLKAIAEDNDPPPMKEEGISVMGSARMRMTKPVIAAVEGYAVAGGMALSVWCDLRVVAEGATFGMFDRRFGVPIIGGLTVRLPKLIGLSYAMDIILTGRAVDAEESYKMGLANRLVGKGEALAEAIKLAQEIASHPWAAVVSDRKSTLEALDLPDQMAQVNEFRLGKQILDSGMSREGAQVYASGRKAES